MNFVYHAPIIPFTSAAPSSNEPGPFAEVDFPESPVPQHDFQIAEAIKLMIISSADPYPQQRVKPRRTVSLPISQDAFHALFPQAIESVSKRKPGEVRPARRIRSTPLWRQKIRHPRDLAYLFGPSWYTTHHQDQVGVFRDLSVVLRRKDHSQWQVDDHGAPVIGSFAKSSALFLHVSFNFSRLKRSSTMDDGVEKSWEDQVEDLLV